MKETTITTREGRLRIRTALKVGGAADGVRVFTGSSYSGVHLNTVRRLTRVIEALVEARSLLV